MPNAILLTPVIPNPNGIGIEKRAYLWYSTLKEKYKLEVLVVESGKIKAKINQPTEIKNIIYFSAETQKFNFLKRMALSLLSLLKISNSENAPFMTWIPITKKDKNMLKHIYKDSHWDLIFCFRLFISQFALFLSSNTGCINVEIDFDDFESQTKKSLGMLYLRNLKLVKALGLFISSFHFKHMEKKIVSKNLKFHIAADIDRKSLLDIYENINLETFNNKISIISDSNCIEAIKKPNDHPIVLFVGALNYYPNEDAVRFFIKYVLHDLNKLSNGKWEFQIIGKCCPESLSKWLKKQMNVAFLGEAVDLSSPYKRCDIVVVPLRGGGGTKIKAIEAIIHSKPFISTYEGVRGLGLIPNVHFYHAETKKEWIEKCLYAWNNREKLKIMTQNALQYILQKGFVNLGSS
jgi:polysaccharide biosynthesis protein PslH